MYGFFRLFARSLLYFNRLPPLLSLPLWFTHLLCVTFCLDGLNLTYYLFFYFIYISYLFSYSFSVFRSHFLLHSIHLFPTFPFPLSRARYMKLMSVWSIKFYIFWCDFTLNVTISMIAKRNKILLLIILCARCRLFFLFFFPFLLSSYVNDKFRSFFFGACVCVSSAFPQSMCWGLLSAGSLCHIDTIYTVFFSLLLLLVA